MKPLLSEIRSAVLVTLVLAVVCCGLYPLLVFGLGQALFPHRANGSLVLDTAGNVRGSRLIGQPFTGTNYFHPRPSAAGQGYDATTSGGSNLGPTSQKLRDLVSQRVANYRALNGLHPNAPIPADAVTASASGLDPHISPENAELQAPRVAQARGLPLATVRALIREHSDPADLGVLGESAINVLELNLALDARGVSPGPESIASSR
jgi:potassium-transporting ATPase KdpC subunit